MEATVFVMLNHPFGCHSVTRKSSSPRSVYFLILRLLLHTPFSLPEWSDGHGPKPAGG